MKEDRNKVSFVYGTSWFGNKLLGTITNYYIKQFYVGNVYQSNGWGDYQRLWHLELRAGAKTEQSWGEKLNLSNDIDCNDINQKLLNIKMGTIKKLSCSIPKVSFFKVGNLFYSEEMSIILEVFNYYNVFNNDVDSLKFSMSEMIKNQTGRFRYKSEEKDATRPVPKRGGVELSHDQVLEELSVIIDDKIKYVMGMTVMAQLFEKDIRYNNLYVLTSTFNYSGILIETASKIVSEETVQNLKDGFSCVRISKLDAIALLNKGEHTTGDTKYIDEYIRSLIEREENSPRTYDRDKRIKVNYFDVFNMEKYSDYTFSSEVSRKQKA